MDGWKELERKVDRAAREIEALRKQNKSLSSQVRRLKRAASEGDDADGYGERAEIERRLRRIAATLKDLLE